MSNASKIVCKHSREPSECDDCLAELDYWLQSCEHGISFRVKCAHCLQESLSASQAEVQRLRAENDALRARNDLLADRLEEWSHAK